MAYTSLCLTTRENDAADDHTKGGSGKQPNILVDNIQKLLKPVASIKSLKPNRIGGVDGYRRNESAGRGQGIISGNSGFDSSDDESNILSLASEIATNCERMDNNNETTHSNSEVQKEFDQINVQKIFMAFMLSCFKSYAMYMIKIKNETSRVTSRFDRHGFLHGESRNDQSSPFFEKFINGQMFEVFISTVECRFRHSVFANAAYYKMHKRALAYKTLSRAGYGSFVSIYTHASTFLIKSCSMTWKPYHMWMFYSDSGPILYISNYVEKVDLLTCAIKIVQTESKYTSLPSSTSLNINPMNNMCGRIKLVDISSALDDTTFMEDHADELHLLVNNNNLQRLEQLRYELLLNAVEHTILLQRFKVELEIPKVVRKNEFTFKISGTRKSPLKRKSSPFDIFFGRSNNNAYEEDVNQNNTQDLAMDNDVNNSDHGNEERTNDDNSTIVVKNRKKDFEFTIAVSKSITRRHWLQRFVWLHRYKQVEKIQHVYSNVNDGIHETCDQMTKRMRVNSIKSYTLGHDETIDDDGSIWL